MYKNKIINFVSMVGILGLVGYVFAANLSGAIFTTDVVCAGTNVNIFTDKTAVYLDGGPHHTGSAGLPDGSYYVKVTEPDGTLLGTSVGSGNDTPAIVAGGEFATCYQLSAILIKASDSTGGYDTTSNGGGVYKVWISSDSTFPNSSSKTDNFKVKGEDEVGPPQSLPTLNVNKFYDVNANGVLDPSDLPVTGWKVRIQDDIDIIRYTPVSIIVDPDTYTVTEFDPIQTNWFHTTSNPVSVTLDNDESATVDFGNVCVGVGGGMTLGFWSNKNGQAIMTSGGMASELSFLSGLNLRTATGADFNPLTYASFRAWILGATATNMANMLSAQLAAMELNVLNGKVNGSALIYAPGTTSANFLGFASVNAVMAEADASLGANGLVLSGNPERAHQEALKNALDKANNNLNFVQATPCPFSFVD